MELGKTAEELDLKYRLRLVPGKNEKVFSDDVPESSLDIVVQDLEAEPHGDWRLSSECTQPIWIELHALNADTDEMVEFLQKEIAYKPVAESGNN